MKVIYSDNVLSITASEADASYPVANLSDEHTKKVWKATSADAVLTVNLASGGALGIANTNATTVSVAVNGWVDGDWTVGGVATSWTVGGVATSWTSVGALTVGSSLIDADTGDLWVDFTESTLALEVVLALASATGTILQAGVLRGGDIYDVSNPAYGIKENLNDHSIILELSNGSTYYRKRDVVRNYSASVLLLRETDALNLMRQIGVALGPQPLMWLLADVSTDSEFIVFGKAKLSQSHDYFEHNNVSIDITEVV